MKRIRDLFRQPQLSPEWTFEPSGIVWRILFNETGSIVGENRFQDEKRVEFFSVAEQTGKCLWKGLSLHDPWWVGLEAVSDDTALFHGFASPDMPEHKGIFAHSISDGKPTWSRDDLSYWFHTKTTVYGLKTLFDRRQGVALDIHSGATLEEFHDGLDPLFALREAETIDSRELGFVFPEPKSLQALPEWANEFIDSHRQHADVMGESDCIFEEGVLICNIYARNAAANLGQATFKNVLFVVTDEGKNVRHEEMVDSIARYPVPDSFFLKGKRLYFVREGRILTALQPWTL